MKFTIRPREISICENDPFKEDLLDRKKPSEVLENFVSSVDGPCVLSIDADWGNGKTTFLKIWSQYLRDLKYPVIEFNAWETDYSNDPFIALSNELELGLRDFETSKSNEELKKKITAMSNTGKKLIKHLSPSFIQFVVSTTTNIPLEVNQVISKALASYAKRKFTGYQQTRDSIQEFRETLRDAAKTLSETKDGKPLIIVIDELDRCRPSYAVELLEIAKHLFSVERIIFVLAVNRSELAHSVKVLYGRDFDGETYLRRFFDIHFQLPQPRRDKFIEHLLNTIQIKAYQQRTFDKQALGAELFRKLLIEFLGSEELTLRQIAQALHHFGSVYFLLRKDRKSHLLMASVVLILRTVDQHLYNRFRLGQVSDEETVDTVFQKLGVSSLQGTRSGNYFEAMMVLAYLEIIIKRSFPSELTINPRHSPLYMKYKKILNDQKNENDISDSEINHSVETVKIVNGALGSPDVVEYGTGFFYSVDRIEMFSTELIGEHTDSK